MSMCPARWVAWLAVRNVVPARGRRPERGEGNEAFCFLCGDPGEGSYRLAEKIQAFTFSATPGYSPEPESFSNRKSPQRHTSR